VADKKTLEWGQTPWDGLTHGELLLTVKRMYAAILDAQSVLRIQKAADPSSRYWGEGAGGTAMAKLAFVTKQVAANFEPEAVYRAFFRYATNLLFPGEGVGEAWIICPRGHMLTCEKADAAAKPCPICKPLILPDSVMRPLTLEDLTPTPAGAATGDAHEQEKAGRP
jgi:hypothetical protein